jgi:hypothetical protein
VFYFDLVYSSYIIFNNKIILKQLFLFVNEFVNINLSDHLFSINLFSKKMNSSLSFYINLSMRIKLPAKRKIHVIHEHLNEEESDT